MLCLAARLFEDLEVADEVADAEGGDAGLARAHHFAGAAYLQIFFGDAEAVGRLFPDAEALLCDGCLFVGSHQHAVALLRAATDATAELVQLRETEALGVLDDHHRGVRHVNADLDDGRRDEYLYLARDEAAHDLFFLRSLHPAVQQSDREVRKDAVAQVFVHPRRVLQVHLLRLLDQRIDDIDLTTAAYLALDAFVNSGAAVFADDDRLDRRAPRRQLVNHRHVEVAIDGHRERTGNRRRRHHQYVRVEAALT